MTSTEQESLLTVALMAAFADGAKAEAERDLIQRLAENLPPSEVNVAALYPRVLLKQVTLEQAAAPLQTAELRQLAYEVAVGVCDADDAQTPTEQTFLARLRQVLQLPESRAKAIDQQAEALATEPLQDNAAPPQLPTAGPAAAADSVPPAAPEATVDRLVLHYALLTAALELLPESLATLAIVPLQMKMVYRIGRHYGHELDRGHIKELLAAAGVGLTSQVLEGYARKLLGGLLGRAVGGWGQWAGRQLASSAITFAATWALGQLARQYYAGGRRFSALELRQLFRALTEQGRTLHARYAEDIQQRAASLDVRQLLPWLRRA